MPIGHLIAAIGLPVLIEIIGRVLGTLNHPAAKTASAALGTLKGSMNTGAITPEQIQEANRHTEELANKEYQAFQQGLSEVNQTIRQEVSSEDKYVRRMRPTFGYMLAISWAAQMLGLAYIMVFETEKSPQVMLGMEGLSAIWAMGLSVLGIYMYKRSDEKRPVMQTPIRTVGEAVSSVVKSVATKTASPKPSVQQPVAPQPPAAQKPSLKRRLNE